MAYPQALVRKSDPNPSVAAVSELVAEVQTPCHTYKAAHLARKLQLRAIAFQRSGFVPRDMRGDHVKVRSFIHQNTFRTAMLVHILEREQPHIDLKTFFVAAKGALNDIQVQMPKISETTMRRCADSFGVWTH